VNFSVKLEETIRSGCSGVSNGLGRYCRGTVFLAGARKKTKRGGGDIEL